MLPSIIVALALSVSYSVAAAPPQGREALHIPVARRHNLRRGNGLIDEDRLAAAVKDLMKKYRHGSSHSPRAQSTDIGITDQNQDTTYFAQVSVGTPPQTMQVVLDTGSSDLWFTTTGCLDCTAETPLFNPAKSSSLQKGTQDVPLSYGSGSADGTLAHDTVSMGPFTVNSQAFVVVDQLTSGLIDGRISGIMGLAFQGIANTAAPPFWQALVTANQLTSPEFSFFITRFVDDASSVGAEEPGGVFTLGGTNSTFFDGDPDFQTFTSPQTGGSFWLQTVSTINVNGQNVNFGTGKSAAIDTGTTLIGAPTAAVEAIWGSVPGAQALTGQMAGFWSFPCTTKLNVSMSFGGPSWPISEADLSLGTNTDGVCVGAIFDIQQGTDISGSGVPDWIVGDTFLKNVYTVFRANPPAVGFAKLSAAASGLSGNGNPNSPSVATPSLKGSPGSTPTGTSPLPGGASWAMPLGIPDISVTSALSLLTAIFMLAA